MHYIVVPLQGVNPFGQPMVGSYALRDSFPTAIKVPTVEHQPSLQKRLDFNVYDLRGRMVRRMADVKDPFNGLPRGVYIYQGSKYLKKN